MQQCYLSDLDGTVAVIDHRLHFVQQAKDWDSFFQHIPGDTPALPVVSILDALYNSGWPIILVTGRPESYRTITEAWLQRYGIRYTTLHMRGAQDRRPDRDVKREMLAVIRPNYEIMGVFDDRQDIVDMWREEGLFVLQCAPTQEFTKNGAAVLTLMVGPSGSGKSSWLRGLAAYSDFYIRPRHVLSSDELREDFCGNFRDQTRNHEVFVALHSIARARLRKGLPTVIDATHIRRKERVAAAALNAGGPVRYIIMNRSMEDKIRDAGWRAEVPDLIARHEATFQSNEGFILNGDNLPNVEVFDTRAINAPLQ